MIFVDASAMVAVLIREADMQRYVDALDPESPLVTSSVAVFETTVAVRRQFDSTVEEAEADVRALLEEAQIEIVPVEPEDAAIALEAFSRYGKGRGHPAQLNMGDCFAYAVAMRRGAALLYKGDDFARTDIRSALGPR